MIWNQTLQIIIGVLLFANLISAQQNLSQESSRITPKPFPDLKRPFIISHRGTRLLAPENAFPSFDLALYFGTDVLETDIRLTKDRQLVIFHDDQLGRVTNSEEFVRNLTLSQLKSLDNAYHFQDAKTGEYTWRGKGVTIPTLQEFLNRYWKGDQWIHVNIEIKDEDEIAGELLAKTLQQYPRHKVATHLNIVSRFCPVLNHFRNLTNYEIPTASCEDEATHFFLHERLFGLGSWISSRIPGKLIPSAVTEFITRKLNIQFHFSSMQVPKSIANGALVITTPHYVQHSNRFNKEVHVWVINREQDMRSLLAKEIGVHALITDRTDIAVRAFKAFGRKKRSYKGLLPDSYEPKFSLPDSDLEEIHECISIMCILIDNVYTILNVVLVIFFLLIGISLPLCMARRIKKKPKLE